MPAADRPPHDTALTHATVLRAWHIMPSQLLAYSVAPWLCAGLMIWFGNALDVRLIGSAIAPLFILLPMPYLIRAIDANLSTPVARNWGWRANLIRLLVGIVSAQMALTTWLAGLFQTPDIPLHSTLAGPFIGLAMLLFLSGGGLPMTLVLMGFKPNFAVDYRAIAAPHQPVLMTTIHGLLFIAACALSAVSVVVTDVIIAAMATHLAVTYILIINALFERRVFTPDARD